MQTIESTAVQVFAPSEAKIAISKARTELHALIQLHKDIKLDLSEISDKKERKQAYEAAKEAWAQYNTPRIEFGKKVKSTYQDFKAQVNSFKEEGDKIKQEWTEQEKKFHKAWKDEDDRVKAEKEKLAEVEKERVDFIKSKIENIKQLPASLINKDAETLRFSIKDLRLSEIDSFYQEFKQEAELVKDQVLITLCDMLDAKVRSEEVAKQQAEEAARLAEERRVFDEQQAKAKVDREAQEDADRKRVKEEQNIMQKEIDAKNAVISARQLELDRQAQLIQDERNRIQKENEEKEREEKEKIALAEEAEFVKKEKQKLAREQAEYKSKIEAMSILDAFKEILSKTNDQYIIDICNSQIKKS